MVGGTGEEEGVREEGVMEEGVCAGEEVEGEGNEVEGEERKGRGRRIREKGGDRGVGIRERGGRGEGVVDQVAQETVGGEGMALSGRVKWEVLKVVECLCLGWQALQGEEEVEYV